MFGRRSDGVPVEGLGIIEKASPHFMVARNDACNSITNPVRCENMDAWIAEKRKEGKNYSYMDVVLLI